MIVYGPLKLEEVLILIGGHTWSCSFCKPATSTAYVHMDIEQDRRVNQDTCHT